MKLIINLKDVLRRRTVTLLLALTAVSEVDFFGHTSLLITLITKAGSSTVASDLNQHLYTIVKFCVYITRNTKRGPNAGFVTSRSCERTGGNVVVHLDISRRTQQRFCSNLVKKSRNSHCRQLVLRLCEQEIWIFPTASTASRFANPWILSQLNRKASTSLHK